VLDAVEIRDMFRNTGAGLSRRVCLFPRIFRQKNLASRGRGIPAKAVTWKAKKELV